MKGIRSWHFDMIVNKCVSLQYGCCCRKKNTYGSEISISLCVYLLVCILEAMHLSSRGTTQVGFQ